MTPSISGCFTWSVKLSDSENALSTTAGTDFQLIVHPNSSPTASYTSMNSIIAYYSAEVDIYVEDVDSIENPSIISLIPDIA
jgi:hypothetical protein